MATEIELDTMVSELRDEIKALTLQNKKLKCANLHLWLKVFHSWRSHSTRSTKRTKWFLDKYKFIEQAYRKAKKELKEAR